MPVRIMLVRAYRKWEQYGEIMKHIYNLTDWSRLKYCGKSRVSFNHIFSRASVTLHNFGGINLYFKNDAERFFSSTIENLMTCENYLGNIKPNFLSIQVQTGTKLLFLPFLPFLTNFGWVGEMHVIQLSRKMWFIIISRHRHTYISRHYNVKSM